MDRSDLAGCVLCRTCSNYVGRQEGRERRRSPTRICAAGIAPITGAESCESYVRAPRSVRRALRGNPEHRAD